MLRLDNGVRHDSRCGAVCNCCAEGVIARMQGQLELIRNNEDSGCSRRQRAAEVTEGPCCLNEKLRWWGCCGPASSGGLDVWSSPLELCSGEQQLEGKVSRQLAVRPRRSLKEPCDKQPGHQASLSDDTSCKAHLRHQSTPTLPAGGYFTNAEGRERPHHDRAQGQQQLHRCIVTVFRSWLALFAH
jgi:hypothetical protein